MKCDDKKEGGKCFVWFTYSPLSFLKRGGGKGGELERKNKMAVCFFKLLKSKIKH
jgi:hypothetical protein